MSLFLNTKISGSSIANSNIVFLSDPTTAAAGTKRMDEVVAGISHHMLELHYDPHPPVEGRVNRINFRIIFPYISFSFQNETARVGRREQYLRSSFIVYSQLFLF